MRLRLLASTALLLLCGLRARADELYTLTLHVAAIPAVGVPAENGVYTFTVPEILTYYTIVSPPLLQIQGDPLHYLIINPLNQECGPNANPANPPDTGNNDTCIYLNQFNHSYLFQSYGGPLTSEGFYPGASLDLEIASVPPAATPEPSSLALLATGITALSLYARRRARP